MKKCKLLTISVMMLMLCVACGAKEKTDNISLGMEAVQNLEYTEALQYFNAALEEKEDERLVCRGMGLAYMGLSKYEDALAYFKNGQTQDALQSYDAILALRPKEIEAYYLRGYVKLCGGNFESAKEDFDKTISLEPQNYDRLIQIYNALMDNGYREVGKEYLQQVIANNEKSISNYDLGRIYYYLEDYESAKNYLSQVKISSDYEASLYLGRTYEALGDYNYASSIYNDYTLNDQSKAEIYNQLGLCRMQMEEYELALMAFQSAMNIEGNEMMQTLKFNEIIAYEYMKEYKTAAALMSDYLKTYPDDEAAQRENLFLKTR